MRKVASLIGGIFGEGRWSSITVSLFT